jgi:hypothetical protein
MNIPGVTDDEIQKIVSGEIDLSMNDVLYSRLYDYFVASGEMPYGVAKARTEDPLVWIVDKLSGK